MDTKLPPEYERYRSIDPFPEIQAALLNSADISDYVETVKIVAPFNSANLKPASYEVPFSGTVFWWDIETKKRQQQEIKSKDDTFILRSNSIAYVQPDTTFYLPDYIALRFNLRITHVHQGLLLGTGPLVDPGFCGRLLIPLHNLTANEYVFVHGNGFIWVDFTKLSPNNMWKSSSPLNLSRRGSYVPFRDTKKFLTPDFYFNEARKSGDIVSSIPDAIKQSKDDARSAASRADLAAESAKKAEVQAQQSATKFDRNLWIGGVGVVVALIAAGFTLIQIFQSTLDSKTKASEEVTKAQIDGFRQEIARQRADEATKTQIDELRQEINKIRVDFERAKGPIRPADTAKSSPTEQRDPTQTKRKPAGNTQH